MDFRKRALGALLAAAAAPGCMTTIYRPSPEASYNPYGGVQTVIPIQPIRFVASPDNPNEIHVYYHSAGGQEAAPSELAQRTWVVNGALQGVNDSLRQMNESTEFQNSMLRDTLRGFGAPAQGAMRTVDSMLLQNEFRRWQDQQRLLQRYGR